MIIPRLTIKGEDTMNLWLKGAPERLQIHLREEMQSHQTTLRDMIRRNIRSRSGKLARSVSVDLTSSAGKISLVAQARTPYARIIERGGQTRPHVIMSRGNALAFQFQERRSFFVKIFHPGSRIAPQRYMRRALEAFRPTLYADIKEALRRTLATGNRAS